MIRKIVLILAAIIFPVVIQATGTEEKARQTAIEFLQERSPSTKKSGILPQLKTVYESVDTVRNRLYCFQDESGGFVLVAVYNDIYTITAWSDKGRFDTDLAGTFLSTLLNQYETGDLGTDAVSAKSTRSLKSSVAPLLKSVPVKWGQGSYFNGACPFDEDAGMHTMVGCLAVSMGQIMRYHRFPYQGTGSHSYMHHKYGVLSADFGNTTYNWDDMPGEPDSPDENIAELLYQAGVATEMNYGVSESGAYLTNAAAAFRNNFGYRNAEHLSHSTFSGSPEFFFRIIRNEIDANRPVLYELMGDPGHTVVADGYDGNYFHLNFGWQGYCDGYYLLEGVQNIDNKDFHMRGNAIVGISPVAININEQDSIALAAIYNNNNGSDWIRRNGWMTDAPVNQWQGVTMVSDRVIGLDLSQNRVRGQLPGEIGNLTSLYTLNLSNNQLSGNIPAEVGNLPDLFSLELRNAGLTGTIPAEIGNLRNLQKLDLTSNQLSGSIPAGLYELEELTWLSLADNNLSGQLLPEIGNLNRLRYLSLWKNQLEGPLPSETGSLTQLQEFYISENRFSGPLPESIGSWTEIREFNISGNELEGQVPGVLAGFSKLTSLNLSSNRFTALPDSIGKLHAIRSIDASNNYIESIPSSVSGLKSLTSLNLFNNRISRLPEFDIMPALRTLQLTSNLIETVPSSIENLVSLYNLYLGNNLISELPSTIENMTSLRSVAFSGNRLTFVPVSISFLPNLRELYLYDNNIAGQMPPLGHLPLRHTDLRGNNLVFADIASSQLPDDTTHSSDYIFDYHNQAKVPVSDSIIYLQVGDQALVDIRKITRLSHPANMYEWYRDDRLVGEGPLLVFDQFSESDEGIYTCRVRNSEYSKALVLETMPFKITSSSGAVFDGMPVVSSRKAGTADFSDNLITLKPPADARGQLVWQVSADSISWHNIAGESNPGIPAAGIISSSGNRIVADPVAPVMFRYMLLEEDCDPVYSDTVRLMPYGDLLIDTILNVTVNEAVIATDSIEIIVPAGLTDGDFRITVRKVDNPPPAPDSVISASVYDVKLSIGNIFDQPLIIKLKNVDKNMVDEAHAGRFSAVYYDDRNRDWVRFNHSGISLKDSTIVFLTDHLTKLSWWWDTEALWGYTDVFVRGNIKVFYREGDIDRFNFLYGQAQTAQPWHLHSGHPEYGTPLMIQDAAFFLEEVINEFRDRELKVPNHNFSVFVTEMDDYGQVGLMGMLNHYLTINRDISTPESLRSLMAHEFMHYTQDNYITSHAGNIFWMEAHAHLADRMVWDESVLPVSESDQYLLSGRSGNNTIFEFLANSWDYWDKSILTHNLRGNVYFCYIAGTFLHYMRSYKPGDKLQPDLLLKETPYLQSWLNYLDSHIGKHMNSNAGDQYEDFVKYILEGTNSNFSLLSGEQGEDPLKYLRSAHQSFMTTKFFRSAKASEGINRAKDSIKIDLPYMSAKMVQMYNLNSDHRKVVVKYKRNSVKNENISVYLCRFNSGNGTIEFDNITGIDSSYFFIESPVDENLLNKKHIVWLLFINKEKSGSYKADYDLEIIPVPDIRYFNSFGFTIGQSLSEALIHTFSDGEDETVDRFWTMPGVFRIWEENYSSISYDINTADSLITAHVYSDHVEQTFSYNFITGEMVINNREVWGDGSAGTSMDIREVGLELRNVWLNPHEGTQSRFGFSTQNTAQTKDVVQSITYSRKHAVWNPTEMQHEPMVTTTYLRTSYESEDVKFHISYW